MADWKIVLVVLVGLLLITAGLFTEIGLNIGGIGENIRDALGRGTPFGFLTAPEEGNVTISGRFYIKELNLKVLPLEEIKMGYEPVLQDMDFFVADTKLTTQPYTEMDFTGYKGTFFLNNSRLSLVGDAEETTINGIKFETVKKLIPVKMEDVVFKNVYVKRLDMNRLEMEDVLGEINVQNRVTLELVNEPLKLESFSGSVNITEDGFEIKGVVKRVFVSCKDYTATVS